MASEQLTLNGLLVEREAGPGPKVLFVHGAGGGSWYWRDFMGLFAEAGFDCYAMNLRGHGGNPPVPQPGRIHLADYVSDAVGVAEALGEVVLVGHSMGGAIVQAVALKVPPKALVLAASAPVKGVRFRAPSLNPWMLLLGIRTLPAMLRGRPLPASFRAAEASVLNRIEPGRRRTLFRQLAPESSTAGMELVSGAMVANLAAATYPKLTVAGEDDRLTVIAMERELAAFQNTEFMPLPGHGHLFMLEPGWEACARRIVQWLHDHGVR